MLTLNNNLTLKISVAVIAIFMLTSCNQKKNTDSNSNLGVGTLNVTGSKPLASCNAKSDSSASINVATVVDSYGQVNTNYVKLKFNSIESSLISSNAIVRFYKWRASNNVAQNDTTALKFASYNLSTNQTNSSLVSGAYLSQMNSQNGLYIQLNDDPNFPYQVLKMVISKTDGTTISQMDILIPQFYASAGDYQYLSNGTARSNILQVLHPLYSQNTSGWSDQQFIDDAQAKCF